MALDSDLQALLYTVMVDFFLLLICHTIYVLVSDSSPLDANLILSRTKATLASGPRWLRARGGSTAQAHAQEEAQAAVKDVVVPPRIARLSVAGHARRASTVITPTHVRRASQLSFDGSAGDVPPFSLEDVHAVLIDEGLLSSESPEISEEQLIDSRREELQVSIFSSCPSPDLEEESAAPQLQSIDETEDEDQELGVNAQLPGHASLDVAGTPLYVPPMTTVIREALGTQASIVQVVEPAIPPEMDVEESVSDPAIRQVLVFPVQEGAKLAEQVRVTPPLSLLRFALLEPLFERVFPPISILGCNAIDGFVYLKFVRLMILVIALMTVICVPVLVPLHEEANENTDASSFTAASIISVPEGSTALIGHFVVAYALLCIFLAMIRLLSAHARKATELTTALTDDRESLAAARTLHLTQLPLGWTEARLRTEIVRLMPPEKKVASIAAVEILSISLCYDTEAIDKIWTKRARVLNKIERLEILAAQIQANPNALVKDEWLVVLKGKDTLTVKQRLEGLAEKRRLLTIQLVGAIGDYYSHMNTGNSDVNGGDLPLASLVSSSPPPLDASPSPSPSPSATLQFGHSSNSYSSISNSLTMSNTIGRSMRPQRSKFSGQAFVAFRWSVSAAEVMQQSKAAAIRSWTLAFAPKPSDIMWSNLAAQRTRTVGAVRWLIANSSILALLLFVGIPSLVLHQITTVVRAEVSELKKESSSTANAFLLIANYLTTLLLWIINWRLLPALITKALDFEKHATMSSYLRSRFWKGSLFFFAIMIVLPLFAMTTIASLLVELDWGEGNNLYAVLSGSFFTQSGIYFAQWLTHEILISIGVNMLHLPMYLKRIWRLRSALTQSEFEFAREEPPADLSYDRLVAMFGLLLLNAVSVPLLLPFGLVFFIAQYNIDLYKLRRFKIFPVQNKGVVVTMATRCTLLYLAGWMFLMSSLFFVQGKTSYSLIGVFFSLAGLATAAVYAMRDFSTRVPVETRMSALKHLDERIRIFADRSALPNADDLPNTPNDDAAAPAQQWFVHPHTHRAPLSHAASPGAQSRAIHSVSHIPPEVCPDCLYRHPIWNKIEADDDVLHALEERAHLERQRHRGLAALFVPPESL